MWALYSTKIAQDQVSQVWMKLLHYDWYTAMHVASWAVNPWAEQNILDFRGW